MYLKKYMCVYYLRYIANANVDNNNSDKVQNYSSKKQQ